MPLPLYPELKLGLPGPAVSDKLEKFNPDLIHVVNPAVLGLGGIWLAKTNNIPLIASYHTHLPKYLEHYGMGMLEPLLWELLKAAHNQALLNLCTSTAMVNELKDKGIQRTALWQRGVDTYSFRPDLRSEKMRKKLFGEYNDANYLLIYVGRLSAEKQIEKFRIREVKELETLERISLKEKRDDYSEIQERIDKLKEKYRLIRDQKIRERLEALGIKTLDEDDRETLLKKEKNYIAARQLVETSLESFYRSASSLVFQLNKRHLTRDMSIFRCIDRRFETGEIFIKWDESSDDEWLILIYIKDNSPEGKIVIEDKCNHEKYFSDEYQSNEIFKASDKMVDSLTQLLYRERSKNVNQSLT